MEKVSVTKTKVMYTPLINYHVYIMYHNSTPFKGILVLETRHTLHISTKSFNNSTSVKVLLKSGISRLFIFDSTEEKYVEIHPSLIQNTLVARLKKMK